jgi:hypothetical protein
MARAKTVVAEGADLDGGAALHVVVPARIEFEHVPGVLGLSPTVRPNRT